LRYAIPILGVGLFAVAAYGDVRTRRIPNALVIAVAALGLVRLILAGDPGVALDSFAAAAAILAAGFLLFWRGLFGGGDVKLMAAAVLLVGYHALPGFLVVMGLCGLFVTLAVLAAAQLMQRPAAVLGAETHNQTPARATVPYAVPIAASGILTLILQSPISW
jgi:prepilin peptidase CpaA